MTRSTTRSGVAALVISVPLLLGACGSSKSSSSTTPAAAATGAAPASSSPATTQNDPYGYGAGGASTPAASATGKETLQLATVGTLGPVLVTADGLTLYLFEKDTGLKSACSGACLDTWPAYTVTGTPSAGSGLDASELKVVDGAVPNQLAYHGHLLYRFAADAKPGDAHGVGLPSWYPVTAAGDAKE